MSLNPEGQFILLLFLLAGAVAGWRARFIVNRGVPGLIGNVVIGSLSVVIGGYLGDKFYARPCYDGTFYLGNICYAGTIAGAIGAVIVLAIIGLVKVVRPIEGDEVPKADRADKVKRAAPTMPVQFVRDLSVLDAEEVVVSSNIHSTIATAISRLPLYAMFRERRPTSSLLKPKANLAASLASMCFR